MRDGPVNAATFDEQIRRVLERALTDLSGHLEADLSRFAQDLMRVAGEERHRATVAAAESAAADIKRQTDAQVAELRKGFQEQLDGVRRAARQQLEDARLATQAQVADVQRALAAELEETRRTFEAQVEESRRLARAEVEESRLEAAAANETADADRDADEVAAAQLALARAEAERAVAEAAERTRTDAHEAELAAIARLVDGIRLLDEGSALGSVLDGLAECASREVERAAVTIVNGDRLRGRKFKGFDRAGRPTSFDLDLDAAGLLSSVVRTGAGVSRSAAGDTEDQDTGQAELPAFAQGAGPRHAVALPVIVGGHVVAVLYADEPQPVTPSAARWPAMLEVLTRHAGRVLEAMTVEEATGLHLRRPVARASHAP
jgi:hypothetical protein